MRDHPLLSSDLLFIFSFQHRDVCKLCKLRIGSVMQGQSGLSAKQ